ncbi:MAG: sulfur carrier protein ThiS [Vicinamibacteria bacterium]
MSDDLRTIGITVNGTASTCPARLTVEGLLQHLNLPVGRVAVERNREIVRRDQRETVLVQPGDVFEIVTFVGGG